MNDRYTKLLRGSVLYIVWLAYNEGLTDVSAPRTVNKLVLETALMTRGLYPEHDMPLCLDWLQGAGYLEVDWAMDNRRDYDSVTITQKALDLILNRNARTVEPHLTLPPRR